MASPARWRGRGHWLLLASATLSTAACSVTPSAPPRPTPNSAESPRLALVEYSAAVRARLAGDWASSERALRRALAHDPRSSRLLRDHGRALLKLGRPAAALEVLRRSRTGRDGVLGLEEIAECARQLEDYETCVQSLHELLERDPFHERGLYRLHAVYLMTHRTEQGVAFFRDLAEDSRPDWAFSHEALGDFLLRQGRPREALDHYTRCRELGGPSSILERKLSLARERTSALEREAPADPRIGIATPAATPGDA